MKLTQEDKIVLGVLAAIGITPVALSIAFSLLHALAVLWASTNDVSLLPVLSECETECVDRADLVAQKEMARAAWAMVQVTIASLLVGIVALLATVFSVFYLRRTLQLTQRTNEMELRAYIQTSPVPIKLVDGEPQEFAVSFENVGQTPAYEVSTVGAMMVLYPPFEEADYEELRQQQSRLPVRTHQVSLGAGKSLTSRWEVTGFTREVLLDTANLVFVFGRVEYQDALGKRRQTHFMYRYTAKENPLQVGSFQDFGNAAD